MKNLLGIDPYIKEDVKDENGLEVQKKTIKETEGKWDIIMLHHSFEHFTDPLETLQSVSALLSGKGSCIIRIPIASSYAWEHYGINWVQLDAPRHIFLHSIKSMRILAEQADLDLYKVEHDSTDFQFWGSEQYLEDIPLRDKRSYAVNPSNSKFSKKDITDFTNRAKELNENAKGDMAIFYLKKN
ncbi:MAG: class I SAM-dependent methyltransferase [Melioribacteraceae bacterium]|nr:class I SAM-dependent methyltransferase [Melioribacteraceae bacterium]